jgi:hypothetical protein
MHLFDRLYLVLHKHVSEICGIILGWLVSVGSDPQPFLSISDAHDIFKAFLSGAAGGLGAWLIKKLIAWIRSKRK